MNMPINIFMTKKKGIGFLSYGPGVSTLGRAYSLKKILGKKRKSFTILYLEQEIGPQKSFRTPYLDEEIGQQKKCFTTLYFEKNLDKKYFTTVP